MTGWDREYLANKDEYLKIFGQGLAEEHIKKLKQENGVKDVNVDQ